MENKTAQHTPGPWYIAKTGGIYAGNAYLFAAAIGQYCGRDEAEANTRLIAAAPELLEALLAIRAGFMDGSIKFTKKRISDSDPYHPANTLMCAAIAKAKGE